jgi:polyhydroxyalkanoate synthesis regulator phasin
MPENQKRDAVDRMVAAYDRMLKHTHDAIGEAQRETVPRVREILEKARDQMVELGELTREEAAKVADYVERDVKDAAAYIAETGAGLRAWWRFDLRLMEERMLEAFTSVADQTSLQLREWAEQARRAPAYRTGEVTGPGTLVCEACGEALDFVKAGRIPPCPKCGGTAFRRAVADPPQA